MKRGTLDMDMGNSKICKEGIVVNLIGDCWAGGGLWSGKLQMLMFHQRMNRIF
jgi:hypothetical protein